MNNVKDTLNNYENAYGWVLVSDFMWFHTDNSIEYSVAESIRKIIYHPLQDALKYSVRDSIASFTELKIKIYGQN